jgi:hypothetical protein
MNLYKLSRRQFSFATKNYLKSDFNLTKTEIRLLNNELKKPWVRPGWDKVVSKYF